MVMPRFDKIAFVASDTQEAREAHATLAKRYGGASPDDADAIVALGGDGLMLQTMHNHLGSRIPIYGMNRGSVGFLLNDYSEDGLIERLAHAEVTVIHPLRMTTHDANRVKQQALAINEVSLFRQIYQAAKLKISVSPSSSATGCWCRRLPGQPPTISRRTVRSCRSVPGCSRSPRSAHSAHGVGAARSFPTTPK